MNAPKNRLSVSLIVALAACQPAADEAFFAGDVLAERANPASAMSSYRRDLAVSVSGPASAEEGATEPIEVVVENLGSRSARNVSVAIDVDSGVSVSGYPSACALSGSTLTCDYRRLRSGSSKAIGFDATLPSGEGSYLIAAEATTTDADGDNSNNADQLSIEVAVDALEIADGDTLYAASCYSAAAIGWGDCTSTSGLSYATLTFNADGSMVLSDASVSGTWAQDSDGTLDIEFRLVADSSLLSTFTAAPVSSDCVEGSATYDQYGGYGGWSGCLSGYPSP